MSSVEERRNIVNNKKLSWSILLLITLYYTLTASTTPVILTAEAPIPEPGFRVMVVENIDDRPHLSEPLLRVLTSTIWKEYCNAHCIPGEDGTPEWRIFGAKGNLEHESQLWQDAFNRPRSSTPWLVVSNGETGTEQPLPNTGDLMMSVLERYTPEE